jgi:hypothetical protein
VDASLQLESRSGIESNFIRFTGMIDAYNYFFPEGMVKGTQDASWIELRPSGDGSR